MKWKTRSHKIIAPDLVGWTWNRYAMQDVCIPNGKDLDQLGRQVGLVLNEQLQRKHRQSLLET